MKTLIVKSFRTDLALSAGTDPNVPTTPVAVLTVKHVDDTLHLYKFGPELLTAVNDQFAKAMDESPSIDERDYIESRINSGELTLEMERELSQHPIIVHSNNIPPRALTTDFLPEHYVYSSHMIIQEDAFVFWFVAADGSVSTVSFERSLLPYLADCLIRV